MKEAAERRRQATIDNFWSGGGLCRFLHPPSPSLHSPVLRGQVISSVRIQGTESALNSIQLGPGLDVNRIDPEQLLVFVQSSIQLA